VSIAIAGVLASALLSFRGTLVLTEGEEVFDGEPAYEVIERRPLVGASYSGATLVLEETAPGADGPSAVAVSRVAATTAGGEAIVHDTSPGAPLELDGSTFITDESGNAAVLVIRPEAGAAGIVTARLEEVDEGVWAGDVAYATEGAVYGVELTGELPSPADASAVVSDADVSPLAVRLTRGERELGEARLAPGELVETEEVTVTFRELSGWTRFTVARDPGRWVAYAGLVLVVAGAVWRFLVRDVRLGLRVRTSEASRTARVTTTSDPWRDSGGWSARETTDALRRLAERGIEDAIA
jgi:hypothetical protein